MLDIGITVQLSSLVSGALTLLKEYGYSLQVSGICKGKQLLLHFVCFPGGESHGGWMTCNLMSFSTVFQSYQDGGQMIRKGSKQWNPIYN